MYGYTAEYYMKKVEYYKNCCTGCGLCQTDKGFQMEADALGFLSPGTIDSEFCDKVCPVLYYQEKDLPFHLWGMYTNAYEGYSLDQDIRYHASSGGILTSISVYLLEKGIVDGIIHTGISHKDPMKTMTVISYDKAEVTRHAGSRYCISAPLSELLQIIENGKKYAFIGKPCDVMALKRYMSNVNDLSGQIIFTMSFFCAGMPSDRANRLLLSNMGCDKNKLKVFKYRGNGWPGYATAIDLEGKEYKTSYENAWSNFLGRDVKKICRYCMDGIGEAADLACADLWYLTDDNKPDFSERDGRSLILCRNEKAETVFKDAVDKKYVYAKRYESMDSLKSCQPYHYSRRVTMRWKLLALKIFGRFSPNYNKRFLKNANRYSNYKEDLDIFKGTIKRIIKGKL